MCQGPSLGLIQLLAYHVVTLVQIFLEVTRARKSNSASLVVAFNNGEAKARQRLGWRV